MSLEKWRPRESGDLLFLGPGSGPGLRFPKLALLVKKSCKFESRHSRHLLIISAIFSWHRQLRSSLKLTVIYNWHNIVFMLNKAPYKMFLGANQ